MMKMLINRSLAGICCLSVVAVLWGPAYAADKPDVNLKVGEKAPEFKSTDDQGKAWNSKDHIGKKILVVYFYPADLTGGCTKQACGFRDDMKTLKGRDVEVVGVSGDSVKNHKLFKKIHKLNFTLLADEDGSVAKKFGVPLKKGGTIDRLVAGENYKLTRGVTAERWTFVIDKEGKVAHKHKTKEAAKDSQNILKLVKKLQK